MKKWVTSLAADFSASIVVALIALPLCLGIALGSQAPLFSGIISGVIGAVIVGILSKSPLSVSGPAAGLIAVVVLALQKLGSFEAFLLATLIAGCLQICFGFLRLGTLGDFIPNSVIKGMMAAIGIVLIIKQLPHFIGFDVAVEQDESFLTLDQQVANFFQNITQKIAPLALMIGITSVAILLIFKMDFLKKRKFVKFIPAPLIVVVVGAMINQYFKDIDSALFLKQEHLVFLPHVASFADLQKIIILPDFSQIMNGEVWLVALTIALIASVESLLCIEAVDKLDTLKRRTDTNHELKAQGIGNAVTGLCGGLPITSVIVRSAANANSGAQSKISTILQGVWLLVAVALIPNLLNKIPYATLAAILILTGYKLTNPKIFKENYKLGYDQLIPFLVTIIAILASNLLLGIVIGIITSFAFILYGNFKSAIMLVSDGTGKYLLRLRKDVSFLNKAKLKNILEKLPKKSQILIDVSKSDFIDKDVIEVINDFQRHAHLKRIEVVIKKNNFNPLHQLINHHGHN